MGVTSRTVWSMMLSIAVAFPILPAFGQHKHAVRSRELKTAPPNPLPTVTLKTPWPSQLIGIPFFERLRRGDFVLPDAPAFPALEHTERAVGLQEPRGSNLVGYIWQIDGRSGFVDSDPDCLTGRISCDVIVEGDNITITINARSGEVFPGSGSQIVEHYSFNTRGDLVRHREHTGDLALGDVETVILVNRQATDYKSALANASLANARANESLRTRVASVQQRQQANAREQAQRSQAVFERRRVADEERQGEDDAILAEARARREGRAARQQADHAAAMAIMLGTLRSVGPRPSVPAYPSYTPRPRSAPAPVLLSAAPQATEYRASRVFGALPYGIGTSGQRDFYVERCQGRPDDGSAAAQGCHQTLSGLSSTPSQAPPTRVINVGGLSSSGGSSGSADASSSAATPTARCISMRPQPGPGLGFWQVVNSCSFSITGSFYYGNDRSTSGGFQVGPGGTDGVSPPPRGVSNYHFTSCKLDEWNKGICHLSW